MKNPPVYQNLDTSFVNLAALVRFLRSRRFVGSLRVELEGYEADLDFDADNFTVREHDRIAGRIAEGDEAFARLLIRARAPGGTINVSEAASQPLIQPQNQPALIASRPPLLMPAESFETTSIPKPTFAAPLAAEDFARPETARTVAKAAEKTHSANVNLAAAEETVPTASKTLDSSDFEFTNHVEELARQKQIPPAEWQQLLHIISELLAVVDRDLARANLNFAHAFARAGTEISADYPFLNPASGAVNYADGRLIVNENVSAKIFVAGINEALRRILNKLAASPKFEAVYSETVRNLHALAAARKPLYDKFFITPQLERVIGAQKTLAA